MSAAFCILLVEDEADVRLSNKEFLERSGYRTLTAATLHEAARLLKTHAPDLILMDILLPDGNGLDFLARLRDLNSEFFILNSALHTVPVLFLTCLDSPADIIAGLSRGGCDYVTKPYDFGVLLARIEAQLRRAGGLTDAVRRGPLTLDIVAQRAYLNGADMLLRHKEFSLLLMLVKREGRPIPARELYEAAWHQPMAGDGRAVWAQVSRLKKKLEAGSEQLELTATRGDGYMLTVVK